MREGVRMTPCPSHQVLVSSSELSARVGQPAKPWFWWPLSEKLVISIALSPCGSLCSASLLSVI
jgi:hypothetical protein